jgi:hypothetical protein
MPSNQPLEFRWKHSGQPIPARILKIVSLFLFGLSVVLLAAVAITAGMAVNLKNHGIHVTGTVDELIEVRDKQIQSATESGTYAPKFSFIDKDGRPHSVTSHYSSSPASFAVGDQLPVLYSQGDPESAQIYSVWQVWYVPIFIAIFCFATTISAIFLRFMAKRKFLKEVG